MRSQKCSRQLVSYVVTRVEVYGLFLAAIVIGSSTMSFATDESTAQEPVLAVPTATVEPVQIAEPQVATEIIEEPLPQNVAVVEEIPHQVEYRLLGPWIGPSATLAVDSQNYICAWAVDGYGGRGYGFGPEAVCNQEYLNYISSNCGTKNDSGVWSGIIDRQLCNEWESHTLRIQY